MQYRYSHRVAGGWDEGDWQIGLHDCRADRASLKEDVFGYNSGRQTAAGGFSLPGRRGSIFPLLTAMDGAFRPAFLPRREKQPAGGSTAGRSW